MAKYRRIKVETGYCGCDEEYYYEFPDDMSDMEIYEFADDLAYENALNDKDYCLCEDDDISEEDYFEQAMSLTDIEELTKEEWDAYPYEKYTYGRY